MPLLYFELAILKQGIETMFSYSLRLFSSPNPELGDHILDTQFWPLVEKTLETSGLNPYLSQRDRTDKNAYIKSSKNYISINVHKMYIPPPQIPL